MKTQNPWEPLKREQERNAELLAMLKRVDEAWNPEKGARLERLIGTTTCNVIRAAIAKATGGNA